MTPLVFFLAWAASGVGFCFVRDRRRNGYWGLDLDGRHRRWLERHRP